MKKIDPKEIQAIVCDFDGVLTDNKVYVDQKGREMVCCSRADGLAFGIFKRSRIKSFILSTEKNPVVAQRAGKLKIPVCYGVNNKLDALKILSKKHHLSLDKVLYVGNDINDLEAMSACGWRACPADAYGQIRNISQIVTKARGGDGVVRELLDILKII